MSGKGSAPRPFAVSQEDYANRWNAVFSKDKPCTHEVWGHAEGSYFCINCGLKNDDHPYAPTFDRSSSAKSVDLL